MPETCTKCGLRDRTATHRWCRDCQTAARNARRNVSNGVSNGALVVQSPGALDRESEDQIGAIPDNVDPETGEVLEDPRVHEEGWRGLPQGRGGIGWQAGHGPDSGRLCCKHLVCYDALRPMVALTKGVQPGAEIHPRRCWCTGCRPTLIGRSPAEAAAR